MLYLNGQLLKIQQVVHEGRKIYQSERIGIFFSGSSSGGPALLKQHKYYLKSSLIWHACV